MSIVPIIGDFGDPGTSRRAVKIKHTVIQMWKDSGHSPFAMLTSTTTEKPQETTTDKKTDVKPVGSRLRSQSQQQAKRKTLDQISERSTRNVKSSMAAMKSIRKRSGDQGVKSPKQQEKTENAAIGSAKRRRRKPSSVALTLESETDSIVDTPPKPKPAWEQFSDHIQTFDKASNYTYTNSATIERAMEALLKKSGSEICQKILKDMKDQLERRRAKELLLQQMALEAQTSDEQQQLQQLDDEEDEESEDEEEYNRRRRKAEALRHWGIIRRDIQEKIRIRKEKNPAGGTWNALRSQLRAMTRADNVRKELYEKYGIVAKDGHKYAEDTMKPTPSIDIKDVVNKFYSFQIRRLRVAFS